MPKATAQPTAQPTLITAPTTLPVPVPAYVAPRFPNDGVQPSTGLDWRWRVQAGQLGWGSGTGRLATVHHLRPLTAQQAKGAPVHLPLGLCCSVDSWERVWSTQLRRIVWVRGSHLAAAQQVAA